MAIMVYNEGRTLRFAFGKEAFVKNSQEIMKEFAREVGRILGDSLSKIILYGSYARGDYHDGSDMDLMILTDLSDQEIEKEEKKVFDLAFELVGVADPPGLTFEFDLSGLAESPGSGPSIICFGFVSEDMIIAGPFLGCITLVVGSGLV